MIDIDRYRNDNGPRKMSYETEEQFEYRLRKHAIQCEIGELERNVRIQGQADEEDFLKLLDILETMNE